MPWVYDDDGLLCPFSVSTLRRFACVVPLSCLAFSVLDWSPEPPDRSMGLTHPVTLHADAGARLRYPGATVLDLTLASGGDNGGGGDAGDSAALQVIVQVENGGSDSLEVVLMASLDLGIECRVSLTLAPFELRDVALGQEDCPALLVTSGDGYDVASVLWWPWQMGSPTTHGLNVTLFQGTASTAKQTAKQPISEEGDVLDALTAVVGFAKVDAPLDSEQRRYWVVNGRRLLVRGGGWAEDILLRSSPARFGAEMAHVRNLGLNTVRLEGKRRAPVVERCEMGLR